MLNFLRRQFDRQRRKRESARAVRIKLADFGDIDTFCAAYAAGTRSGAPTRTLDIGCGTTPRNPFKADEVFGIDIREDPARNIRYADLAVEPDASAATYFWAAEALTGGAIDLGVPAEEFTQPDAVSAKVIRMFPRMPAVIDGSQMQDAVPTLAVLAAFNEHPVRFTGIANLRVKECDRVAALATELSRIRPGLGTEEGDDLIVAADPSLAGQELPARIETYADHRIAMSFALAGLKIRGITILDPDCVGKTFPGYWDALASLGVQFVEGN